MSNSHFFHYELDDTSIHYQALPGWYGVIDSNDNIVAYVAESVNALGLANMLQLRVDPGLLDDTQLVKQLMLTRAHAQIIQSMLSELESYIRNRFGIWEDSDPVAIPDGNGDYYILTSEALWISSTRDMRPKTDA